MPPPRNDSRNETAAACPVCGTSFTRTGRRRYCTDACRQAAWRHRTATRPPAIPLQPRRGRRDGTVYECISCQARYLGDHWCPECSRPCRRLGPGGHCACGELLTINELLNGG